MLKIYNQEHVLKAQTDRFKDRKIESDVATGDKTLSLRVFGVPEISNEWYIDDGEQEYVVKEAKVSEQGYVDIVAVLNLEELESKAWKLYSMKNATVVVAAALAIQGTSWTVAQSSLTKKRNAAVLKKNALGVIQDLCTAFMCECVFDTRNKIIYFYEQVGEDRGVYAMRGLNLRSLTRTGNSYDFYTRIYPYGEDDLDIKSVNNGVEYLENHQYSSKLRSYIWEDSNYDDPAALKEDATAKLADMSKPKVSYQANIIDLAAMSDTWSLLDYSIGDTITLKDSETGICEKQRIVKMTEYPENPEKNTCELSNTTLTWEELQAKMKAAAEIVDSVINPDGRYNGKIKVSDILNFEQGIVGEDEQQQEVTLQEALDIIGTSANVAVQAAEQAQEAASDAMESALTANSAANGALAQLSVVEDVVGTLSWISEHGTYQATTDTAVVPGKYYFTRSGSGTTADPYVYNIVINPTGDPSDLGYYELTGVDEAVTNYVATHLALTSVGLYILMDNSGYKVLITSSNVQIIDDYGRTVATYGTNTTIGKTDGTSAYFRVKPDAIEGRSKTGKIYFEVADLSGKEITLYVYENTSANSFDVFDLDTNVTPVVKYGTDYGLTATVSSFTETKVRTSARISGDISITYTLKSSSDSSAAIIAGGEANAPYAVAMNDGTADGVYSVAENSGHARGWYSHAEGTSETYGHRSHAEGESIAYGPYSHAEGAETESWGWAAHAGGEDSIAQGDWSFAHGRGARSVGSSSAAFGSYNTLDANLLFQIGKGTGENARADAFAIGYNSEIMLDGNEILKPDTWTTTTPHPQIASGSWVGPLGGKTWTLTPGKYLVAFGADFDSNATGYRMVQFNTSGTGNRYTPTANAVNGNDTRLMGTMIVAPTQNTTYGLYAYQNSGNNSLQVVPWVHIIRLK